MPSSTTPNVVWRPGQDELPGISAWTLYFQKLQSLAYIFAADSISMGLSSFKFVQWAPKDASIPQQSAGRKRILTSNSHSRSFILQSVTGRQGVAYRHIVLLALRWRFRRSSHSDRQKLPSSSTSRSFDVPAKRNPLEYPHKPYISRNYRIINLHFCRW